MKQKLLLALFVLFASVGAMRAENAFKITLPGNSGDVKLTVTGTITAEQKTEIETVKGSVSGNTITLPTSNAGKAYDLNAVSTATWTGLTVNGIATGCEINGLDKLTTLTFTSNGQLATLSLNMDELTTLSCSSNALTTLDLSNSTNLKSVDCSKNKITSLTLSSLGALQTLTCSDNKLTALGLPSTTNKLNINCERNSLSNELTGSNLGTITYGYQYITAIPSPDIIANEPANIKTLASNSNLWNITTSATFTGDNDITCGSSWEKQNDDTKAWSSTSEARKNNAQTYPNDYVFNNGTVYTKGNYRYSVEKKGSTLKFMVEIPVKGAKIPVQFAEANKINNIIAGTVKVGGTEITENSSVTLEAGAETVIEASIASSLKDKVEFDKYVLSNGLSLSGNKVTASGLVSAKTVSIQPLFKAKKFKVNYTAPISTVGGTYRIRVNGTDISSGADVDYGSTLEVSVTPNEGYAATLTKNGVVTNLLENGKASMTVEADLNLALSIVQTKGETKFSITTSTANANDGITSIAIGSINAFTIPTSGNSITFTNNNSDNKFTPEAPLSITITPKTAYAVKDIVLDGKSQTVRKSNATYIADCIVPSVDAKIHIVLTKLEAITSVAAKSGITYTYNGSAQVFKYETSPANLTMTKVEYSKDDGSTWSTTAPTDVLIETGTVKPYKVKVTRNEDANYAEFTKSDLEMTVVKAAASITTIPTIEVVNNNNVQSYKISNGKANTTGVFSVSKVTQGSESVTDNYVPDAFKNKSHIVEIIFTAMNGDKANNNYDFSKAKVELPVKGLNADAIKTVTVQTIADSELPAHVKSLKIYNGTTELKSPATVAIGTTLTFKATFDKGCGGVQIHETNSAKTAIGTATADNATTLTEVTGSTAIIAAMQVGISVKSFTASTAKNFKSVEAKTQSVIYTGSVQKYLPETNGITVTDESGLPLTTGLTCAVTYKDANNKDIALPVNAGTYTASIKVTYASYNEKIVTTSFIVNKANPIITWPTAKTIAKKQTLAQAAFVGGTTTTPGAFTWKTPTIIPENGSKYDVVFTPTDAANFNAITTPESQKVTVTVSSKMLITLGNPVNGTLLVKDANNYEYVSGDEIAKDKVLTITATPNEGFILESLTLNGANFTSGSTYKVIDASVAIVATFKLKSADPSALKVTFTKTGKGFTVDKTDAVVKFKDNFSFTVKTAAADKDKVVVKGGATVLKANGNGTYTLSAMTKDTVISISLATPTKLKVAIEKETKNAKGYKTGKVQIQGGTADSTYYYGDVLTLTAFPETGVSFHSWSDSNTDNPRTYMVTTATTLKPSFTGTPTGIADIEGTKVYGAEGYIYVSCEGQATVTVVTMDGRSQQVRIAGEARIETGAGIYGVILQQGTEVLKTKVVVR